MLFGIPPHLPAELLETLARMGHGDTLALVDSNYPYVSDARDTVRGEPIVLPGRNLPDSATDVLALMPLDTFDEAPVVVMAAPGQRDELPSVHADLVTVLAKVAGAPWLLGHLERFEFYDAVRKSFAIVRTLERRPYGNVILKKGVIAPDGSLMTPESASSVQ